MDSKRPMPVGPVPPTIPPPSSHAPYAPLDTRPPPLAYAHPPPTAAIHPHSHPPPPYHTYGGGPPPPHTPVHYSLPPIQQAAGAPPEQHYHNQLPALRHPSQYPQEQPPPPAREIPEYPPYTPHSRSGHGTPAQVNRTFSESSHQQHTPTTPAHAGQYPPAAAPEGAVAQLPPHQMEHVQYHGYPPTNGIPHGLPPPSHPHEHPHQYSPPIMENHHGYPPQHQIQYGYPPATSFAAAQQQKRKQMRATQACDQCRQRKQKCDEGTPCSFCKDNNFTCNYRDTPPAKTDKNMEKLLSYMESNSAALEHLTQQMEEFNHRVRVVEGLNGMQASDSKAIMQPPRSVPAEVSIPEEAPPKKPELEDHRTAAHKLLLLWPSVKSVLDAAKVDHHQGYVMEAEDRPVMRIWTTGEGIDEHDGTHAGGPASPARSEDSDGNTPNAPDGVWGFGFPPTPRPTPMIASYSDYAMRRSDLQFQGGRKPDGSMDLDIATINKLYDSYMKTLYRMHPVFDRKRLRKLIDRFIKNYGTGSPALQKFAVGSGSDNERPLKRQRSNGAGSIGTAGSESVPPWNRTERSPGMAIVWLILALGKIALHKQPLPGLVADAVHVNNNVTHQITGVNGVTGGSPLSSTRRPSPISPRSTPMNYASPPGALDATIRQSFVETPSSTVNLDRIPGLAYYAKATEILGEHCDGNDLVHAQMFLLAGLYKGQLARVKESMNWYSMAGRAIMHLLDSYKLYNDSYWEKYGDTRKQLQRNHPQTRDRRHSLIVMASWSCLQLESDILAELRLPSSGIVAIESMLPMVHSVSDAVEESYEPIQQQEEVTGDNTLLYYVAQTFLRRRLNQIHQELYGQECLKQSVAQVAAILASHEEVCSQWRDTLPPDLNWDDDDELPADILDARLRGKYWGARYLANRPFLDYALHIMPHVRDGMTIEDAAKDAHHNSRVPAEILIFKAIHSMGERAIWAATQRCIECAMHSTVAFDGVPDRLVVTNIHGTAHAQFGNMLVLSAVYYTKYLRSLVPEAQFQSHLERTIRFLRRLAPISPTCASDCLILERISKVLFGRVRPEDREMYENEIEPRSASASFEHAT